MLEWKISEGGNNGILYSVLEDGQYKEVWHTSPEMQILDDFVHKDGLIFKHRSGDLYDLIACKEIAVRPQGQWNRVRIVKNNGVVEHWLNGIKVVDYDAKSPEWTEMIKKSKFSNLKDFATPGKRRIAFQDHDNQVWFRNLKIRSL
jgi:cytochrome c